MDKKHYFIDFDGTIVDSMPYLEKLTYGFLNKYNLDYPDNIIDIIVPLGYKGGAEYYVATYKQLNKTVDEVLKELEDGLYIEYKYKIPPKSGAIEYLKKLKSEGKKLYVLSASQHKQLDICIDRLGILYLFENVFSCEEFGCTKGEAKLYKMVAEKVGINVSEMVFVDDNINNIKVAKATGCYCVGVFDKSGQAFTEELKEIADEYIEDFNTCL